MIAQNRRAVLATWSMGVGLTIGACSSESNRPPQLGDCMVIRDAACNGLGGSSGGGSGPGEGGTTDAGIASEASGSCGTAQEFLTTQNISCVPCVEGTSGTGNGCCQADLACSAVPACIALLQCALACASGDTTCANNCESQNPNGVTAYNDFAQCLGSQCSPQCPTLPQGGAGDL